VTLRIGSLFSGYGGLDMAVANHYGATTAWFVEFDKHPSAILAHHYPDVPNYGDVTTIDWSQVEPVDIITGGFPCQDVSHAGLRRGVHHGTRSGLWFEMARAIDQLKPWKVVIENVAGLLSADATCDVEPCPWCVGDQPGGHMRALGAVLADLAEMGFDADWGSVRAADAGAPHGRLRVFIVATDATRERGDGGGDAGPRRWAEPTDRSADTDGLTLLPTPAGQRHGPRLRRVATLRPSSPAKHGN
jgi:DNA (cytosine-5)-methyltransferase 1